MSRWLRDFRLIPVVLIAIGSLFALKTVGLLLDGGYSLGQRLDRENMLVVTTVPVAPPMQLRSPAVPLQVADGSAKKLSWMQEMFNYPSSDITGSIATTKPAEKAAMEKAEAAAAEKHKPAEPPPESKAAQGTPVALDAKPGPSAGERALLERLQARRQELDARARELDLRESMLKAAEKKIEKEAALDKAEEAKNGAPGQRKEKVDADGIRFKGLITMYETMKPKEAAKIFDRLDIKVLIDVASQMKPQIMSAIMAQMSPETAERLTVELAAKSGSDPTLNPSNLPKIEGRPTGG
jgi:flagellar motility protein MotE (MotC chaperone)